MTSNPTPADKILQGAREAAEWAQRNLAAGEELLPCPQCEGRGVWECECCDGSCGCSCGGSPVFMGKCNSCKGTGEIRDDYDVNANYNAIQGQCYLGSGPRE